MQSNSYANGNVERIVVGQDHTKDVQAYLDYYNIVGDDDGGKMMTEKEFEEYKKKVAYARANHLYVFWSNTKGYECKSIGPSSMCFCKHRYRSHNFDNIKNKKVNCKQCKCSMFNYIPIHGSMNLKCMCKHSYEDHEPNSKKCLKGCGCPKFTSNYTCDCRMPYDAHFTSIETKEERLKKGKNIDSGGNLIAGIGGLSSFGGMVANAYQDEYRDLLECDTHKMLPQEKTGTDKDIKGNSGKGTTPALDLFNTPNKYSSGGGVKQLGKQMGHMAIKKKY